jgi:hypothetical protein
MPRFLVGVSAILLLGVNGSNCQADYRSAVLADGPIGYWTLDEGTGVSDNLGTLGNLADGEYIGEDREVDPGPGLPGFPAGNKAMRLTRLVDDGSITPPEESSGVTVVEPIMDDKQAFTLSGWFNPTEAENSNRSGLFGQNNVLEFGFIGPSDIHFWAELPGGGDIHSNSVYQGDNDQWHHLAITGNGVTGDLFMYLDGEEAELTQNNSMPLEDLGKESYGVSGLPFNIGGVVFGEDRQFAGALDEVAAFDKYLTGEQILAHYQAALSGGGLQGDFEPDGDLDAADIDALTAAVRAGNNPPTYDVTADNLVNDADRSKWVNELKKTYFGDSDLNGVFDSSDFVLVFTAGQYEDAAAGNSTWATGDWDGNAEFDSGDFVKAFTEGGYDKGPRPAVGAVPEPSAGLLWICGWLAWLMQRRRR